MTDDADARLAAIRGRLGRAEYLPWRHTGNGRIEDSEGCAIGVFAISAHGRLAANAPADLAYLLGIAEAAYDLGDHLDRCSPNPSGCQTYRERRDALRRAFGGGDDARD